MPHFFINSNDVKNDIVTVSDKENYVHIVKSLRSKIGEKLLLIDENQIQYETIIKEITNKTLIAQIKNKYKSQRELPFNLYLAQVPLRSDAQNFIIEKATELGVKGVYPLYSDNCALNKSVIKNKIPKYQRIMYEASKQCERANIPTCFDLITFDDIFKIKDKKIIAFCERNTDLTFHEYCKSNPIKSGDNILVIIGPEGGFSEDEFEKLKKNNIAMLTLGNLILKAETATVAALSNIIYEYNNY